MEGHITLTISIFSLLISAITAWLTLLRPGTVVMTQPAVIFFGPDALHNGISKPKIYLRALLFSTSKRGRVVETMYATLRRNESQQTFNIWVYGEDKLARGSGLFIDEAGSALNHHFLTPSDGTSFQFMAGRYELNVYAQLIGENGKKRLFSQELEITFELAEKLKEDGAGIYFDWGPDSSRYLAHVEHRRPIPDPSKFFEALGLPRSISEENPKQAESNQ